MGNVRRRAATVPRKAGLTWRVIRRVARAIALNKVVHIGESVRP
jgi:hypothetical protein